MTTHGGDARNNAEREPVPQDWLPGLAENWRSDVVSGFIIFLIALPLSLGIALASGAPPIAGVITAIVGGMIVSLLSGSYVTINGPAAGLIVIVLGAITALGEGDLQAGYRLALAVGVVAGAIQIILGLLRAGRMTNFFPLSVVHGMLAGIGVIIMARQLPVALGTEPPEHGIIPEEWPVLHGLDTILTIPQSILNLNPIVALIGVVCILIMILWPLWTRVARIIPAPLVAAGAGIGLAASFQVDSEFLLDLPPNLLAGITFPDFSQVYTPTSIRWIIAFVFVASLESLLTAAAIDKLDPWKRRSDMNREFIGKGAGNMLSSLLGGLPMIAEVVRSSANIFNGAKTRWSNFFHGAFILLFVALVPGVLEMIPLAALAGILIVIGFRLAHPREFVHASHIGKEELLFMVVTLIIVVAEDLLFGILAGVLVGLIVAVVRGTSIGNLFRPSMEVSEDSDGTTVVKLRRALGFGNFVGVRGKLDKLPQGEKVILDFSEAHFVDHTVVERLDDWEAEYVRDGGEVERRGLEHLHHSTHNPLSALVKGA